MMYFDVTEKQIATYMFKQFYINNMHEWILSNLYDTTCM